MSRIVQRGCISTGFRSAASAAAAATKTQAAHSVLKNLKQRLFSSKKKCTHSALTTEMMSNPNGNCSSGWLQTFFSILLWISKSWTQSEVLFNAWSFDLHYFPRQCFLVLTEPLSVLTSPWHGDTVVPEFQRHRSRKAYSCCTQTECSSSVNASLLLLLLERSNMFFCSCQDAFNVSNFCGSDNQSIACDVLRLWKLMESLSVWGGGGEYLWMASNSRGQMNCWIFPRSRFSDCSLCLSLACSLSAPAPSQCAASHCMWHSASVWKSADG